MDLSDLPESEVRNRSLEWSVEVPKANGHQVVTTLIVSFVCGFIAVIFVLVIWLRYRQSSDSIDFEHSSDSFEDSPTIETDNRRPECEMCYYLTDRERKFTECSFYADSCNPAPDQPLNNP